MESLSVQAQALKTPLVLVIIGILLVAIVYLYRNRKTEGMETTATAFADSQASITQYSRSPRDRIRV